MGKDSLSCWLPMMQVGGHDGGGAVEVTNVRCVRIRTSTPYSVLYYIFRYGIVLGDVGRIVAAQKWGPRLGAGSSARAIMSCFGNGLSWASGGWGGRPRG
jgi:hypothetical protein